MRWNVQWSRNKKYESSGQPLCNYSVLCLPQGSCIIIMEIKSNTQTHRYTHTHAHTHIYVYIHFFLFDRVWSYGFRWSAIFLPLFLFVFFPFMSTVVDLFLQGSWLTVIFLNPYGRTMFFFLYIFLSGVDKLINKIIIGYV